MEKIYWKISIKNKDNPADIITQEVYTLGDHPEIARDKVLDKLNINRGDDKYTWQDVVNIVKVGNENYELSSPVYD